jgi:hypothetical protein
LAVRASLCRILGCGAPRPPGFAEVERQVEPGKATAHRRSVEPVPRIAPRCAAEAAREQVESACLVQHAHTGPALDKPQARICQRGTPGRRAVSGMPGRQDPPVDVRLLDAGPFLLRPRFRREDRNWPRPVQVSGGLQRLGNVAPPRLALGGRYGTIVGAIFEREPVVDLEFARDRFAGGVVVPEGNNRPVLADATINPVPVLNQHLGQAIGTLAHGGNPMDGA